MAENKWVTGVISTGISGAITYNLTCQLVGAHLGSLLGVFPSPCYFRFEVVQIIFSQVQTANRNGRKGLLEGAESKHVCCFANIYSIYYIPIRNSPA